MYGLLYPVLFSLVILSGLGVGIERQIHKLIFVGGGRGRAIYHVNAMEGKQNKNMQDFGKKIGDEQ